MDGNDPAGLSHLRRDINAAQNLLAAAMLQLAGRDDRDLLVDGGSTCTLARAAQVPPDEARSGQIYANGTEREHVI